MFSLLLKLCTSVRVGGMQRSQGVMVRGGLVVL